MKLCIIGVIFCFLWVCICAQEASRNKFHPRAPKTHFESRNSFKSPKKLVKNVVEGTPKAPNSFRPSQEKNEEELKKFASHFKTRKAAGFRHDDPVVSKTFALILWTYLHLSFFILIYSSLFWTLFVIHACPLGQCFSTFWTTGPVNKFSKKLVPLILRGFQFGLKWNTYLVCM